jgi:hypothetical protein
MKLPLITLTITFAMLPAFGFAQPAATVTARWQLSADNGATWTYDALTVQQSQSSVMARMWLDTVATGFAPGRRPTLEAELMELHWTSIAGAGITDTIDDSAVRAFFYNGFVSGLSTRPAQSTRWSSILKTAPRVVGVEPRPPGQGPGFTLNNIPAGFGDLPIDDNPLLVFEYRVQLDGSIGMRTVDALWLAGSVVGPGQVIVAQYPAVSTPSRVVANVTSIPATLTVIPAPASAGLVVAAGLFAARRRR